jgi:hypothetical protein
MGIIDANPQHWLPIEEISGARPTLDLTHKKIHDGNMFGLTYGKALSAGSALTYTILTPPSATGVIHFCAGVETSLAGSWTFSEAPETSGGSALVSYATKRSSTTVDIASAHSGTVTWTSSGTIMETHYPGANGVGITGGVPYQYREYILKASTKYGMQFIANATSTYSVFNISYYIQ